MAFLSRLSGKPWIWSFAGAAIVWLAAIAFTRGFGAGGMLTAGLSLAVFTVIVGIGQMFVITLGPGNVDLSLPANIGLASAIAMKVMDGNDSMVAVGLGITLVPEQSLSPISRSQIAVVRLSEGGHGRQIGLLWRRDGYQPAAARAFIELVRERHEAGLTEAEAPQSLTL